MAYGRPNKKKAAANQKRFNRAKRAQSSNKKSNVSLSTKKYVKRVLDDKIEDKHYVYSIYNNASIPGGGFNSAATNPTGLTTANSIIPIITQGSNVSQRIGNRINVKSLIVRMSAVAAPVLAGISLNPVEGSPIYLRCVFYNRKDSQTNNTNDTILDFGPTSGAFTQSLESLMLRYNKDTFNIIKSLTFKLAPCQRQDSGVTDPREPPNGFVPSVFKSFKIKCLVKLHYDDATAQPMHRIFFACGVVNVDGQPVFFVFMVVKVKITLTTHLIYEDA